jgi:two-component system, LuxR family, sensor kinase FixL
VSYIKDWASSFFYPGTRKAVMLRASIMVAATAYADWRIQSQVPLGFMYLFPMLLAGSVLNRGQIAAAAALCTFLTEAFDSFHWTLMIGIPRDIMIFAAFAGIGLLACELVRGRQAALQFLDQIKVESQARKAAEEQLKVLIESSPIAIFTADSKGHVLLANDATHRLLSLNPGVLNGKSIHEYLPALATIPEPSLEGRPFRTVLQCRGRREDGEIFIADVWFSTYWTSAGARLAAMVIDNSEELRTREESSLHQVLTASRILVGAVSHEIRNLCSAISMVRTNLAREGALAQNKDFEALHTLVAALENIATMNLRETVNHSTSVDIQDLLDELRIVIEPSLRDEGIELKWGVGPKLPPVWADRNSLLQVFLNLTRNAERALLNENRREFAISAWSEDQKVMVIFEDTGCGVGDPNRLFHPFQEGSKETGLGLYLSRAFVRSFQGDLRYVKGERGARFIVELSPVAPHFSEKNSLRQSSSSGRPESVSIDLK